MATTRKLIARKHPERGELIRKQRDLGTSHRRAVTAKPHPLNAAEALPGSTSGAHAATVAPARCVSEWLLSDPESTILSAPVPAASANVS